MEEKLIKWVNGRFTSRQLKLYTIISFIAFFLVTILGSIYAQMTDTDNISWLFVFFAVFLFTLIYFFALFWVIKKSNENKYKFENKYKLRKDKLSKVEEIFGNKERIEAKTFVEFNKKDESLTFYIVVDGKPAKEYRDFPYDIFIEYFGNEFNGNEED